MKRVVQFVAFSSSMLITFPTFANPLVVYGDDNRVEVYEATSFQQILAKSAATMIPKKDIISDASQPGIVQLNQTTLEEWLEAQAAGNKSKNKLFSKEIGSESSAKGFCPEEKFVNQPNPGMCSGFLIAPDLVVTAGHCAEIENVCAEYSWVFDFNVDKETGKAGVDVSSKNVYNCKKIVSNALVNLLGLDYGVIQLDRDVIGREPLEIRKSGVVPNQAPVLVIGSPSGLPLKVSAGANVRKNNHPNFFSANLDTFAGNSGSAVFHAETGTVEGILVRGDDDYVPNKEKMCVEVNRCPNDGCRGEDVSRIMSIPEVGVDTALRAAAIKGDTDTLIKLTKLKLWIDFYGKTKVTALMESVAAGQAKSVEVLLSKGADSNLKDISGNAALHFAVKNPEINTEAVIALLVGAKADLEAKNKAGDTPVLLATKNNNPSGIISLAKAGANVNARDSKNESAVSIAVASKSNEVLSALVDAKADLEATGPAGETVILAATKTKNADAVAILAKGGADLNVRDWKNETPVMIATYSGANDVLKQLLVGKAKLEEKNTAGETAFLMATKLNNVSAINLLAGYGANLNAKDAKNLNALLISIVNGSTEVVDEILKTNIALEERTSEGDTALLIAVKKKNYSLVTKLCNKGANVNAKDSKGETAIYEAIRAANAEVVKALLKFGSKVNVVNNHGVAASDIAKHSSKEIRKIIRKAARAEKKRKI